MSDIITKGKFRDYVQNLKDTGKDTFGLFPCNEMTGNPNVSERNGVPLPHISPYDRIILSPRFQDLKKLGKDGGPLLGLYQPGYYFITAAVLYFPESICDKIDLNSLEKDQVTHSRDVTLDRINSKGRVLRRKDNALELYLATFSRNPLLLDNALALDDYLLENNIDPDMVLTNNNLGYKIR